MIERGAQDAEHLRLLRALNFQSVILVPLIARERVLGVLTLCMTESGRHYAADDLALAEDLGRRAGVAIDTVRLLADAREASATAQAAAARMARLQHVTALLAGALTEREVAETVIREGLPAFGALEGVIYLLSSDGEQPRAGGERRNAEDDDGRVPHLPIERRAAARRRRAHRREPRDGDARRGGHTLPVARAGERARDDGLVDRAPAAGRRRHARWDGPRVHGRSAGSARRIGRSSRRSRASAHRRCTARGSTTRRSARRRGGRGGERREARLPRDDEPRAAHAAQRDRRLRRSCSSSGSAAR